MENTNWVIYPFLKHFFTKPFLTDSQSTANIIVHWHSVISKGNKRDSRFHNFFDIKGSCLVGMIFNFLLPAFYPIFYILNV